MAVVSDARDRCGVARSATQGGPAALTVSLRHCMCHARGEPAVHRQLQRLEQAGLVIVSREGNQKYYAPRTDAPVFQELRGLVVKTVDIVEPIRAALAPIADDIDLAFVFGSVAKGSERAGSDIDLREGQAGAPVLHVVVSAVSTLRSRK
jgi:hypothetical protein